MNQFDLAMATANTIVQYIVDIQFKSGEQTNMAHREFTDDFVNSDLCDNMIENIKNRLKQKGYKTEISFSKVDDHDHHQIEIKIL